MTIFIIILFIILCICILVLLFCLYLLHRNNKVADLREFILYNHPTKLYNNLPSYDTMLFKFWTPLYVEYWIKNIKEE